MGGALQAFYNFWSNNRKLFYTLLLIFCSVLTYGLFQLKVTQDVYSILPEGKSFEKFNTFLTNKSVANKVFFLVELSPSVDEGEIIELLSTTKDSLHKDCGDFLQDIVISKEGLEQDIYSYYYSHFPLLIDSTYYDFMDRKLQNDSVSAAITATYRKLVAPGGGFLRDYLLNDPLFISQQFFEELESAHSNSKINFDNGIMYTEGKKSAFIYASLINNDTQQNETLYQKLKVFKANWNQQHPDQKIDFFGSFQIAAENSLQIKEDTQVTLSITIVAVLLILLLFFKKLTTPFFFILPAIFGGLFAVGVIGFIHPEISGLSIATGAILFGIVLDYSFHYFTHLVHTKSIEQTGKEIASPLITGSLTTIMAFGALMFANSVILRDFGIFATLTLIGASLFTILLLPIILRTCAFDVSNIKTNHKFLSIPSVGRRYHVWALFLIAIITLVMYTLIDGVKFDADLTNLSYQEASIKDKEEKFVGTHPDKETKIYYFAKGVNIGEAAAPNYQLYQRLKSMKEEKLIESFNSAGDFIVPPTLQKERLNRWNTYWNNKSTTVYPIMDSTAQSLGFSERAFGPFKSWISGSPETPAIADSTLMEQLELGNLINNEGSQVSIMTSIVVNKDQKALVKEKLEDIPGLEVFDRADMASSLISMVKDDFNYLLLASALIVFLTLWIIYGRLELTLMTFLPMVISWIWILGVVSLLDIKFNFANVVITTFIFGLGDDFSIFVSEGLINKYKYKKDTLSSYKVAITLSALTTIIGTGVLYFAKHPAIHSIAVISVLGISMILFISLIVQPIIFNFFIQHRVDKGKAPITIINFLMTFVLFALFLTGCIAATGLFFLLYLLPIPKKTKLALQNGMISLVSKIQIYAGIHVKKRIIGKENLDFSQPSIIIVNHSSVIDILLMLMLNRKLVIVVKEWVYNSPFFGLLIRHSGYIFVGDDPEKNQKKTQKMLDLGYSIVVFPEGSRSLSGELKRFHKGPFFLAKQFDLDITPIMIFGAQHVLPKNDYIIGNGTLTIKVLPRIKHDDLSFGESYQERTKKISRRYKEEFQEFKKACLSPGYCFKLLFQNFVYKGPMLEWYLRIKWKFESSNYLEYDEMIGNRKNVLDLGCGLGYLVLFLHYRDPKKKLLGIDYDDNKIEVALNIYNKTEDVTFRQADVTSIDIAPQDVIFINDVLHYLSREEQIDLINKAAGALNENGILFIRDGVTDFEERHKMTLKTEKYSTNVVGFNKKSRDFSFFSSKFIQDLASKNNLTFEMKEQSKKTSNVLMILRKS